MKVDLCSQCDAACCRIFYLPKRCTFKWAISIKGFKHKLENIYGYIWNIIFTRKIKDPEMIKFCGEDRSGDIALRCILLRNNRCLLYKFRPLYCAYYECHGGTQIWHGWLRKNNKPLPEHINRRDDDVCDKLLPTTK